MKRNGNRGRTSRQTGATTARGVTPAPPITGALLQQGMAEHRAGNLPAAEGIYRQILEIAPQHSDALHLLGLIAQQRGDLEGALELMNAALEASPTHTVAWSNRGNTLKALGRKEEALASYDEAIRLKPEYAAAYINRGALLHEMQQYRQALASYDQALPLAPNQAELHNNRGNTLAVLGEHAAALESFEQAIRLRPNCADFFANYGNTFQKLGDAENALAAYNKAIELNPASADLYNKRGHSLEALKRHKEALASFDQAFVLNPQFDYLCGVRLFHRRQICDWEGLQQGTRDLEARVQAGERAAVPYDMLTLSHSAALQRQAAETHARHKYPEPAAARPARRHDKIRIGYFSADFREHPVSRLMAEVFERHDRSRFEIVGFSYGPDANDAMRERVQAGMDRFLDVRGLTDREIARLSQELEIDIAVDLTGTTKDGRLGIFAHRAAPVQVNYLGHPGTMGASFIDYLIADRIVVPEESQRFYTEKIVYLPDCFQANDSTAAVSASPQARAEQGLPEDGFVYCCFNVSHKITPEMFAVWMRILQQVEGSVLWLLADKEPIAPNLRKEAAKHGIAPERLVFAPRVSLADHLARHALADLFLDTLPFNAGATASPALWAGVPVLTCMGEAFNGRMAASLLHAIGLPELITTTLEDYQRRAVELAQTPDIYAEMRTRLARNKLAAPLFDIGRFTRHLEEGFAAMYERSLDGLGPDTIRVLALE